MPVTTAPEVVRAIDRGENRERRRAGGGTLVMRGGGNLYQTGLNRSGRFTTNPKSLTMIGSFPMKAIERFGALRL